MTLTYTETEPQFLYAYDSAGKLTHIKHANGDEYSCPNCGVEMIPKQGHIIAWHYTHKSTSPECNAETALHSNAKFFIKERFDNHSLPRILYRCGLCQKWAPFDLYKFDRVTVDNQYLHLKDVGSTQSQFELEINNKRNGGVKPDLLFYSGSDLKAAFEIEVTNGLDAYHFGFLFNTRLQFAVWQPTWDDLRGTPSTIYLSRVMRVSGEHCARN